MYTSLKKRIDCDSLASPYINPASREQLRTVVGVSSQSTL